MNLLIFTCSVKTIYQIFLFIKLFSERNLDGENICMCIHRKTERDNIIIDNETKRKWLGSICISWYSSRRYMAVILSIQCPKQSINQSNNQSNYIKLFLEFYFFLNIYVSCIFLMCDIQETYMPILVWIFFWLLFCLFVFNFVFWFVCLLLIFNENIMKCRIITLKNNWLLWQ